MHQSPDGSCDPGQIRPLPAGITNRVGRSRRIPVGFHNLVVAFDLRFHGWPLTWFGHEAAVRAMEQGRPFSLDDLTPATVAALGALRDRLDAQP